MRKRERLVAPPVMAKRAASRGVVLIMAISIMTAVQARAQSKLASSGWPAFRHDALMTACTPAKGPVLPEVKWKAEFGSGPLGSPVLAADGMIYVPGNVDSALYAVTPAGTLKWVFHGGDTERFVAPPIVDQGGVIYLGSTTNIFYAINSDGGLRWRLKLGGPIRFSANIGSDGTVYVAAQDCNLYAITPAGKLKWKIFLGKLPGNGPAIATDGTIYVVAGEFLKGVKPDGTLRLEFNNVDMGLLNGLIVEGKELFYVTALEKPFIRAISNTPAIRWEKALNLSFKGSAMPAMGKDGTIYFATVENGGVVALNHDGSQRWFFSLSGAKNLTELMVDDSNHVYIVNDKLGLISVSAAGRLRWSLPEVKCAFSPAMGADGMIFIAGDRKLYAVGPKSPVIAVQPNSIVFPQICVTSSIIDSSLIVSNLGTANLEVTGITSSNPAFQIIPPTSFVLLPGEQRAVRVRFTAAAAISYNGTISILSSDPQKSLLNLNVSGSGGVADIDGMTQAAFDTVDIETCANNVNFDDTTYVIRNLGVCNLTINGLIVAGDFAVISPAVPAVVPANGSLNVVLRFTPKTAGLQNGTLKIQSDDPKDPEMVVALHGIGRGVPDIDATPRVVDFGKVSVGGTKRLSIVVKNLGALRLAVERFVVMPSPPFVSESKEFFLDCNERDSVEVAFTPVAPGLVEGKLDIFSNDPNERPFTVELRGTGAGPDIAVEPDTLDFGAVCGDNDSLLWVTVKNEGDDTLRVNSLVFSNPAFSTTHPTSFKTAPGVSEKVPVRYEPVAVREDTGTLAIFSNDPDENPATISLRGEGAGAEISLETTPLQSGEICAGATATTVACIVNPSNCVLQVDSIKFTILPTKGVPLEKLGRVSPQAVQTPIFIPPHGRLCVTFDVEDVTSDFEVQVRIRSNAVNEDPAIRTVRWKVRQPLIAGVNSVAFGTVKVGSSAQKIAQVWNADSCDVRVDSVRIEGGAASAFSLGTFAVPKTINPGDSTGIPLIFAPHLNGLYTDTLLVFNDDPKHDPLRIALIGVGEDGLCTAVISVNPNFLQFGEVALGDTLAKTLKVTNVSECETLHVSNVTANAPEVFFVNLADRQFDLAPGTSRDIKVYFAPAMAIFYDDSLMITSDDPKNSLVGVPLNGNGIGKSPYTITPSPVIFPQTCVGSENLLFVTICNNSTHDLIASPITTAGPQFREEIDDLLIPTGSDSCRTIKISFLPDKVGIFHDTLTVVWAPALNLPPLQVPLSGEGIGPQISGTKTLLFGDTGLGSTTTKSDTVLSDAHCDLRIDSLKIAGTNAGEFRLVNPPNLPHSISPGGTLIFEVEFLPQALGARSAQLNIWSNDLTQQPFVVQLSGNGVAGILAVCTPFAAPVVCLGDTTDPLQYTLCNVGKAPLTISSLQLAFGKAFFLEPPFVKPITLGKGDSVKVSLKFAPLQEVEIDTLLVRTDPPLTPGSNLVLTGNGSNAPGQIQVSRDLVEFDVPLNESRQEIVRLTNGGCQALVITAVDLEADSKYFSFQPLFSLPNTLERRQSLEVMVSFTGYDYGSFTDSLKISSTPFRAGTPAFERIRLLGLVKDGVSCLEAPKVVDFGLVSVGQLKVERLALRNCNTQGRLIVEVAQPPKLVEFKVMSDRIEINQGNTQTIDVEFRPINDGQREDMVRLVYYAPSEPGEKDSVTVVLRGMGTGKKAYAHPNAFTPNGDQKNDLAKIRFFGYERTAVSLRIFDLRGLEVRYFTSSDVKQDVDEERRPYYFISWDGLDANRQRQLPGAYLWMLEENSKRVASGQIVLIR